MGPVVIAGGAGDPNLAALLSQASEIGIDAIDLRVGPSDSPAFDWQLADGGARLAGEPLQATGAFVRYDVFSTLDRPDPDAAARAGGWYTTVQAWAAAASIRVLNQDASARASFKPAVLAMAVEAGLCVAPTFVTNCASRVASLADRAEWIAKPVAGGDFCRLLDDIAARVAADSPSAPMPAIVQRRLASPEMRLYVVGGKSIAFQLDSQSLDYRELQDAVVTEIAVPPKEDRGLRELMRALRMDFGAADFKRDASTGEWVFLELNTAPMFARFDQVCGGKISRAILERLSESPS